MPERRKEMFKNEDVVNHPSHYSDTKIETIDYIEDKMTPEMVEGYYVGNILKYVSRYRKKAGITDLEKAEWYLNRLISFLDKPN